MNARSLGKNRGRGLTKLPLQDHDLGAQRQDLDVFVSVAHRKQA